MRSSGRASCAALVLALCACTPTSMGITVTRIPDKPEAPRPPPLAAESAPELSETEHPGLYRALGLAQPVYYFEPEDLWYQYWRSGWHQAFTWDGHWFEPKELPEVLRDVRLMRPTDPTP